MIADQLLLVHHLQKRLRERLDGKFADKWRNCKVLSNNKDLLAKHKPDAAVVGIPPHLHGQSPARLPPQRQPVSYCERRHRQPITRLLVDSMPAYYVLAVATLARSCIAAPALLNNHQSRRKVLRFMCMVNRLCQMASATSWMLSIGLSGSSPASNHICSLDLGQFACKPTLRVLGTLSAEHSADPRQMGKPLQAGNPYRMK